MFRWNRMGTLWGLVLLLGGAGARAQEGGGHVLYGDLRVDESKVTGQKPLAYILTLSQVGASMRQSRQVVPNNGRYRFQDVDNGEYYLTVDVEGVEVTRIQMIIQELRKTEIRRDIQLQWDPALTAGGGARGPQTLDIYSRPDATRPDYLKAQDAMARKDYKQAAELLERVTSKDPKDHEAWADLGTARFGQNKLADAEKAYGKAIENRPTYLLAQINLGKVLMAQKNFETAIAVLDRAARDHPQSADAQYYLGESCLQARKGSKAVGHLNEAIRLDPVGKAEAHLRLGVLYNAAGMKDRAAAEYEQFLAKKPDHPDADKLRKYVEANKKP